MGEKVHAAAPGPSRPQSTIAGRRRLGRALENRRRIVQDPATRNAWFGNDDAGAS